MSSQRARAATRISSVLAACLGAAAIVAACGAGSSGSAPAAAKTQPAAPAPASTAGGGGGGAAGGKAVGYDCPALISPAELDAASGLHGTTIETTGRGDQPTLGEVAGVTECLIQNANAGTWFGSFGVYTGPSLDNFAALWDDLKGQGATALEGVGTEAVYKTDEAGSHIYAKGANGLGFEIALAWSKDETTESAVLDTLKKILNTVIPRT
jgi:hypothetical protein